MRRIHLLLITLLFITSFRSSSAEEVLIRPQRLAPEIVDSLCNLTIDPFRRADYYNRAWMHEEVLNQLEKLDQNNPEALWRLARARINIGENLQGDQVLDHYEQALADLDRAVYIAPQNPLTQQTLAVACGRVALFKGVFKSISLVKRLRSAALTAVALNDSMPVALYVLGRTHKKLIDKPGFVLKLFGLSWVREDSVAYYFDRALEVSQRNMIQCFVEYADFLIETSNNKVRAKELLSEALALPLRDEQDAPARKRAEKMLKEIG